MNIAVNCRLLQKGQLEGILGYDSQRFAILAFLVLNQFLTSFTLYLRSNIAGMQMHTANSLISVLDRALMILFCAALIWGGLTDKPFQIEWFVYAQTAAYLITTLFTFGIVLWKSKFPRFRFDRLFFIVVLKQSLPYALLVLLMTAYTRADMVIIDKVMGGPTQAGIYNHGFRLFDAAYQFAMLFAVLLFPMFSKMLAEKDSIVELTRLSSLLLFVPSIAFAVGSMFYREEIMILMEYEEVVASASIYSLLMFAFLGMAGTIIYGTLLTANGNLKILNITSAIAVVINITLNIILIPKYMAFGAAITAVVTQSFVGFSQYVIAARKFKFGFDPKLIFKLAVFILGVLGLGLGSKQIEYLWWVRFLGMLTSSMILAMALNLIDLKSMIKLVFNGEEIRKGKAGQ